ncbi:MAG TPA: response regulator transcription factor [Abditibacterium sp.]
MDKILIIDDDEELCELVSRFLAREGFSCEAVHDGGEGATRALDYNYALLVLDVMLPTLSGFDVLRRVRAASNVPVLMLTARGEDLDRIVGLEIGADDYLAKPFNPRELSARIRAILRRVQTVPAAGESQTLHVGDVEIDFGARLARQNGNLIDLTGAEFDLLVLLLQKAGTVVTKLDLVRAVLGRELSPYDRSIDTLVSNLRRKLGRDIANAPGVERIKAVRGNGYIYALTRPS